MLFGRLMSLNYRIWYSARKFLQNGDAPQSASINVHLYVTKARTKGRTSTTAIYLVPRADDSIEQE
jgi:hypothetical protein